MQHHRSRHTWAWRFMLSVGISAALLIVTSDHTSALPISSTLPMSASDGPAVAADDEGDALVGTGGLLLPGTADEGTRQQVARCAGCSWRVTSPCVESALGNAFDQQSACRSVTRGCQVGSLRRTWFRPATGAWRDLGLFCLLERPLTTELLSARVFERLKEEVPPTAIDHLPADGVVTGLPTVFSSRIGRGPLIVEWQILGQPVRVVATPSYLWTFPDGRRIRTDDPGELTPGGGVRHVFPRSGVFDVTCSIEWSGSYTVPGLGAFPISGVVRDEESITVHVGEGRALLRS